MARPSDYNLKIADTICAQLAEGISLRTICLNEKMPDKATVFRWLRTNDAFRDQYARAKEESADAMIEELQDLGDMAIILAQDSEASSAVVQAVKLKSDNIKWAASKLKPKKYGDKVDVTSGGESIKGNTIIVKDFGADTGGQ